MIYFDNSATTFVHPEVLNAMMRVYTGNDVNANSRYGRGLEAMSLIQQETLAIQRLLHAESMEVIYTSGATEANNTVFHHVRETFSSGTILLSPFEHASIVAPAAWLADHGFDVILLKTDQQGCIDLEDLRDKCQLQPVLVSVMAVEGECGIIQPLAEIATIVRSSCDALLHTDATQAIGKLDVPVTLFDFVSFSGHKFHAPKGIGVLLRRLQTPLTPLLFGGHAVSVRRATTPDQASIVALSCALERQMSRYSPTALQQIGDVIRKGLADEPEIVFNHHDRCIASILNCSYLNHDPRVLQQQLDHYDIAVGTGSACNWSDLPARGVLALCQDAQRARSAIRLSFSMDNTVTEAAKFVAVMKRIIQEDVS